MGSIKSPKHMFLYALVSLLSIQTRVFCYTFNVGDLNCWGKPPPANPNVYSNWISSITFNLGDSLLFLYPPSQDSVNQVTQQEYYNCYSSDPILKMNDGNSLYNITGPGNFFFISGVKSNCQSNQKLHVYIPGNGIADAPDYGPISATPPSYTTAFGSDVGSPFSSQPRSSPSSSPSISSLVGLVSAAVIGLLVWGLAME